MDSAARRALRFHFEHVGPFTYIVDTQHPEKRDWSVDISKPFLQQSTDYAIVARLYDATTNGPLVIIAGSGSNGTEAAAISLSPRKRWTRWRAKLLTALWIRISRQC